jgi:hypothetical protein
MKENVSVDEVIELLNESFRLDPEWAHNFVETRTKCNDAVADHQTIQSGTRDGIKHVGPLGFLNGLFGVDDRGYGPIAASYDDKSSVASVRPVTARLTGFCRTPGAQPVGSDADE